VTDHSINNAPAIGQSPDIWRADHEDYNTNGISYLTIHNWTEKQAQYMVNIVDVVPKGTQCEVRDIWANKEMGSMTAVQVTLRAHASAFYVLHNCTDIKQHTE